MPTEAEPTAGASVEIDPDLWPEKLQARLMAHYLATDDPIIWRLLED